MKAKKLPSGSYRVRISTGKDPATGKYIYKSFTADTAREAERLAYEWEFNKREEEINPKTTLAKAMEDFNENKKYVLSPSTITGYESLRKGAFKSIENFKLQDISSQVVQVWINEQAIRVSPKTIQNNYSYFLSVMRSYHPDIKFNVIIPQKKKAEYHIVTDEEMKLLLKATEGTELGLAIRLAAFIPARRSEICAICPRTDIKGNFITINKAMVQEPSRDWVIKQPKTYAGYRTVEMPPEIIKMIPKNAERAVNCNPSILYEKFRYQLKKLGLNFRFHDLRHYGATFLHAQGVPDKYILQRGGWSSVSTLQNIYTHCLPEKTDEATKSVISKLNSLME